MQVISVAFLPETLGAYAAVLASIASIVAVTLGFRNKAKIQQVHVLVNSNLQEIKQKLSDVTDQRDTLAEQAQGIVPEASEPMK
jgi:hypothetical protein